MSVLRIVLLIVGPLSILLGLHWIGQGTGSFPWPHNPIMDNHIEWAWSGLGTMLGGITALIVARRT